MVVAAQTSAQTLVNKAVLSPAGMGWAQLVWVINGLSMRPWQEESNFVAGLESKGTRVGILMSSVRFSRRLTEFYRVYAISINPAKPLITVRDRYGIRRS